MLDRADGATTITGRRWGGEHDQRGTMNGKGLKTSASFAGRSRGSHQFTPVRWLQYALVILLAFFLFLALQVPAANAHYMRNSSNGATLHWNKGGSTVYVWVYNTATNFTAADYARQNVTSWNHPVYLNAASYATEVALYDFYQSPANYCGLGGGQYNTSSSHWILGTAYATLNRACPTPAGADAFRWKQGIFCQELGHAIGLDHSNYGDCMGLTYWQPDTYPGEYYFGSHPTTDLTNLYRYHQVQ